MAEVRMIQLDPTKSCLSCLTRQCHVQATLRPLITWGCNAMVLATVEEAHIKKSGISAMDLFVAAANACLEYEPDEAYAHLIASDNRKETKP